MSPFAQLESDLTSACYAALANVTVTPQAGGASFAATLDHATRHALQVFGPIRAAVG